MFAFVIAAGDIGKRGLGMGGRRARQDFACGIGLRQRYGDAAHAPGAAEIQAIEMHQFWIGTVGHYGRL